MSLKTGFLSDYQVLFLLLNGPQIEKKVCSLIDRFMTSEGGVILILPFTSNTGQTVAQNRQRIFFICALRVQRGHFMAFYMHNFKLKNKRELEIELHEHDFLPF